MSIADLGWRDRGRCRRADLTLFFTPDGELPEDRPWREGQARAICYGCPVAARCLDYRLSFGQQRDGGIWGGCDEDQRRALRRARVRYQQGRAA